MTDLRSSAEFGPEATTLDKPLVCLGEALIDLVALGPRAASLAHAETFRRAAGGAPANVAVGAARLGQPVGFVGKVGADAFGDYLRETLRDEGVDVTHLGSTQEALTALAFVSLDSAGQRDFLFYRRQAADTLLRPDEVDEQYVARAAALHVGSLSLVHEPARGATLRALQIATRHGVPRSVDANLRLDQWPSALAARTAILDAVAVATVVKLSDDELEFLTGSAQTDAAGSLLHDELRLIAITRGAAGTDYLTHDGQGSVPGFSVAAVDSTGAGDAFVAALLTALCANPDLAADAGALRQALRRANAFAALTVTRHGAIPALPTLSELEAFLDADSDGGDSRFM